MEYYARPFTTQDAKVVVTWPQDLEEVYRWSSDLFGKFPVDAEDLLAYYAVRDAVPYVFCEPENDAPIGHYFLRYSNEKHKTVRIGFVLLDPRFRGKGCGAEMVRGAVRQAFGDMGAEQVTLGVLAGNEAALRCYESCGFTERYRTLLTLGSEEYECIEMEVRSQTAL